MIDKHTFFLGVMAGFLFGISSVVLGMTTHRLDYFLIVLAVVSFEMVVFYWIYKELNIDER